MTAKHIKQAIKLALFSTLLISPQMTFADHNHVAKPKNNQEMHKEMPQADHNKLDITNLRHAVSGVASGGQPSESDLEHFKNNGYSTIINLRAEGEFNDFNEHELVEEMGMNYINIPISIKADFSMENIIMLDAALKAADGKALLHCGSGDRAGAMLALKAFHIDGLSADEAIELGLAAGMVTLEPTIRGLLNTTE